MEAEDVKRPSLWVSCLTCGVSECFFTSFGATYFELLHVGHEVKNGRFFETSHNAGIQYSVQGGTRTEPAPEVELNKQQPVRLRRLLVELTQTSADRMPVFQARGFGGEGEVFVVRIPLQEIEEVRSFIDGGHFVQENGEQKVEFVWTLDNVEMSLEAEEGLRTVEGRAGAEAAKLSVPAPVNREPTPVVEKPIERVKSSQETQPGLPLLLARSSYIQDSPEIKKEAAKVSQVLMAFRWNIAPPYGINVMFDDNLSIQSNTGAISDNLIRSVEKVGYRFIAFDSPTGIPTAWFKRDGEGKGAALFPDSAEMGRPQILPETPKGQGKTKGEENDSDSPNAEGGTINPPPEK